MKEERRDAALHAGVEPLAEDALAQVAAGVVRERRSAPRRRRRAARAAPQRDRRPSGARRGPPGSPSRRGLRSLSGCALSKRTPARCSSGTRARGARRARRCRRARPPARRRPPGALAGALAKPTGSSDAAQSRAVRRRRSPSMARATSPLGFTATSRKGSKPVSSSVRSMSRAVRRVALFPRNAAQDRAERRIRAPSPEDRTRRCQKAPPKGQGPHRQRPGILGRLDPRPGPPHRGGPPRLPDARLPRRGDHEHHAEARAGTRRRATRPTSSRCWTGSSRRRSRRASRSSPTPAA